MKEEVIQFYLDMERSATKREAKERREQGLEVLDVDDDAMWTAAGFKNWSNDQYDQLLVDMDRRRVEGKASARKRDEEREARRKARRQEREELDKQEPAALEKFLARLRKEFPTVPTAGWQVRVVYKNRLCAQGRCRYTPPPMRPDEIPSTPPLPTEFTSMVKVWEYCEQRWRVTRTVSLPVEHAAALEKFLALLRKEFPTVPIAGWQVRLRPRKGRKDRCEYTPPPMRADEIPSGPPLPTDSLVRVWLYCEQRWRVTRTVPAPVKRQMTLGFAVAPKKPRT
jgi:hypothetical protein